MPLVLLTQVREKLLISTTGNKNLTDPTLIMSSTGLGSAVQHYAQDPATLTQSERDANVKEPNTEGTCSPH